jgi:hypothetical protein
VKLVEGSRGAGGTLAVKCGDLADTRSEIAVDWRTLAADWRTPAGKHGERPSPPLCGDRGARPALVRCVLWRPCARPLLWLLQNVPQAAFPWAPKPEAVRAASRSSYRSQNGASEAEPN